MNIRTKVLLTVLCAGALGSLAAMSVFGAFSATTTNAGNEFSAGTVAIGDNDANAALYTLSNAKPGDSVEKCIKVTYTGSLDADVHLYTTSSIGSLGQYVDLTITPGTQATPTFPSCTGFEADSGGSIYSGTLAGFGAANDSYANGVVDNPGDHHQVGERQLGRLPDHRDPAEQRPRSRPGSEHGCSHAHLGGPQPVAAGRVERRSVSRRDRQGRRPRRAPRPDSR